MAPRVARSLAPLPHSLAPHCLIHSRARLLTDFGAHGKEVYKLNKMNMSISFSFNPLCALPPPCRRNRARSDTIKAPKNRAERNKNGGSTLSFTLRFFLSSASPSPPISFFYAFPFCLVLIRLFFYFALFFSVVFFRNPSLLFL